MATVELKNVKKIYPGGVLAVHDFNLSIKDKEFVVFVGPSGCGKSTTLRMVAGLEDISEGTVEIDGVVVNDMQPKERGISMVFQNYALYPHLTVYENMAFPLRLDKKERVEPLTEDQVANHKKEIAVLKARKEAKPEEAAKFDAKIAKLEDEIENGRRQKGYNNDQIYERVTNAAKILGITQYLTRKPKNLSGGQRQRVAIGRAMVRESKVFLMDEPLSNLDAKLRNQMRAEIILLRQRIQTTFIYVTHDQTEAMTLGDRIVIMKDGFIMQVGTPEEVFDRPGNLFVAEFIGAPKMNTFMARLVKDGAEYHVEAFGVKMPVTGDKAKELAAKDIQSQTIVLGVRPEHMTFSEKPQPGFIPCKIEVNEMMGSEVYLHVLSPEVKEGEYDTITPEEARKKEFFDESLLLPGGSKELIVRVQTVTLTEEQRAGLVPGKEVFLGIQPKVMHFFSYKKGELKTNLIYGPGAEAEASLAN